LPHIDVYFKSLASEVLLKKSKEIEASKSHTDNRTCDWLWRYGWEVMDHPARSLDLEHGINI